MYVIALQTIKSTHRQVPDLIKGEIYKVLKKDKKHFFIKANNHYGMFGHYKEKFKVLQGDTKVIELLYSKGNNDSI